MKRTLLFILSFIICISFAFQAFAGAEEELAAQSGTIQDAPQPEETQDASQPRLMVTSYKIDGDSLSPQKESEIQISIKNQSGTKAVSNIKLSILDETGDIKAKGMGTEYVERINAKKTYTWKVPVVVSKKATTGEHHLSVTMEYEDKYYTQYTASDVLTVNVKQSVGMDFDSLTLPVKVHQGDTQTVTPNIINTGKSTIRNCKIDFSVEGLDSGGTLFIGEIPAGESKNGSANLRVSEDVLGEIKGTATIYYEDEFGESYEKTVDLSTNIEKKIPVEETQEEEKENNNNLWWVFVLAGLAAGGALGFGIPVAVRAKKQRDEDDKRL